MRYFFLIVILALVASVLIAPDAHLFGTATHLPSLGTMVATLDHAVRHLLSIELGRLPR